MSLSMTFLQLAQRLREKSGSTGTGPISVLLQTGESLRQVNWIQEAWNEIQMLSANWKWMRKDFSFQTTVGKSFYLLNNTAGESGITDFGSWYEDTFRCYTTALGRNDEQFVPAWNYDTWRDTYDYATQFVVPQRPQIWAEHAKDQAILFGPTPDAVYTITGQYQACPTAMTLDITVPELPAKFHMIIVYRAMMLYGAYEAAPEVFNEGEQGFERLYSLLKLDQLEHPSLGEPLA